MIELYILLKHIGSLDKFIVLLILYKIYIHFYLCDLFHKLH